MDDRLIFGPGRRIAALTTLLMLTLVTPVSAQVLMPESELVPVVDGTPEERSWPFLAWFDDLTKFGYVEEEYLLSGTASLFGYVDDANESPEIEVTQSGIPYVTRMLVRRPADGQPFSGTVLLEVLNATAGFDGAPMWDTTYRYLTASNAAWVGITYAPNTAAFMRDTWGQPPLAPRNNSRYATLDLPDPSLTWDIFMQAARLMRTPGAEGNPFAAFDVERIIITGYSQSHQHVVAFANSVHPIAQMPDGTDLFDGYYSGDGGRNSRAIDGEGIFLPVGDQRNFIDAPVPAVRFQTEWGTARRVYEMRVSEQDFPLVRIYEMAGGGHVNQELGNIGDRLAQINFGSEPDPDPCDNPPNPMRLSFPMSAIMQVLEEWIRDGTPPPDNHFIDFDQLDPTTPRLEPVRDSDGNATGGIRMPTIELPLGQYLGNNSGGDAVFCSLYGSFLRFGRATLNERYPDNDLYVRQMQTEVSRSVSERFLLPADGATLVTEASNSDVGVRIESSGGGGAWGFWSLLVLLGLALMRRLSRLQS